MSTAGEDWAKAAKQYAANFEVFTSVFASVAVDRAIAGCRPGQRVRFLDNAAGTGAAVFKLLEKVPAIDATTTFDVTAADISAGMLAMLQEKYAALSDAAKHSARVSLTTLVVDAMELTSKVPAGSFDAITCVFGIMFPPDPLKTIREMYDALAPGGKAVMVTWHFNDFIRLVLDCGADQGKTGMTFANITDFGTEDYIRCLCEKVGLGDRVSDISFVSNAMEMPVSSLVAALNSNPAPAKFAPWDLERAENFVVSKRGLPGRDVPSMLLRGTALFVTLQKPAATA